MAIVVKHKNENARARDTKNCNVVITQAEKVLPVVICSRL